MIEEMKDVKGLGFDVVVRSTGDKWRATIQDIANDQAWGQYGPTPEQAWADVKALWEARS